MAPIQGFFAYPSRPEALAETVRNAIQEIRSRTSQFQITLWEDARVGGRLIIQEICRLIDGSEVFLADLTGTNANVMFELGYAVGRRKRIWVVLDTSWKNSKRDYEQLRLLTGMGYAPYRNSNDISAALLREKPFDDPSSAIFVESIEPNLSPGVPPTLVYLRSLHETEADRKLSETIARTQRDGLPSTIDDPNEARVHPLAWYGQKIHAAVAVIAHLSSEQREGGSIHNARYSFICGLAHALGKPLLMLAESDYEVPIDYQHLLVKYRTAAECVAHAQEILEEAKANYSAARPVEDLAFQPAPLSAELRALKLGEYVAENEAEELEKYFLETAAYHEALRGRHTLFVGRKGSGKTANLLRIATELGRDRRNLVVIVKPVGYDLDAVVRLLKKYRERDAKGYLVESLWKFLLYTEVARVTAEALGDRTPASLTGEEQELLTLMESADGLLREDFAVRLERSLELLLRVREHEKIEDTRVAISEALHAGLLRDLRASLGRVLRTRAKVVVLVDNLDKSWSRNGELDELTSLLWGMLGAASRLPTEFRKDDYRRTPVNLSLTVFLRSDIFQHIMRGAREPDKVSYSKLTWEDSQLLLRIVEHRFAASRGSGDTRELWDRFLCKSVRGVPTREYIVKSVLPRPRDILFLTRAAVQIAVNRAHARVEEDDVLTAEQQYSQYALDTIQGEGSVAIVRFGDVLYEFLGAREIVDHDQVQKFLEKAGIQSRDCQMTIEQLCACSFLGMEIREDEFEFANDEDEMRKISVMARKLLESRSSGLRYKINRPFHAFLEISG